MEGGERRGILSIRVAWEADLVPSCICGPPLLFDVHLVIGDDLVSRKCWQSIRIKGSGNTVVVLLLEVVLRDFAKNYEKLFCLVASRFPSPLMVLASL